METIYIKRLHPSAVLPQRKTQGSVGYDLSILQETIIIPGDIKVLPTGWAIELPPFLEGQIRIRSSWALKGLIIVNSPGTIDSDYRGEITLIVGNIGKEPARLQKGERIAQLVLSRVVLPKLEEVIELQETQRGGKGFGSTGN